MAQIATGYGNNRVASPGSGYGLGQIKVIEDFMTKYHNTTKEWYEGVAVRARKVCERLLKGRVEAIYEHRSKDPDSLRKKLYDRHPNFISKATLAEFGSEESVPEDKKGYQAAEDITEDIIDFAGVRIIIFFSHTDQWNVVRSMINDAFNDPPSGTKEVKTDDSTNADLLFPGFTKRHYRVNVKEDEFERGWSASDVCEIQVRSTAMHAWANISHKHFYKPKNDHTTSKEEKNILISLNGLIHSQELLLGQLWELRRKREAPFKNKHDLGTYLEDSIPQPELHLERKQKIKSNEQNNGTLKILRKFLKKAEMDTPEKLEPVLQALDFYNLSSGDQGFRRDITNEFKAHKMLKPSVYIIRHILKQHRDTNSALQVEYTFDSCYSEKCAVVISALIWVHKLFIEYQAIEELLCDPKNEEKFTKYMVFIYRSIHRNTILTNARFSCTTEHKEAIDGIWKWFEEQEERRNPSLALAFTISKLGVLEDLPKHLPKMLYSLRYSHE